jgi:uncharacterized protein (UPF0276 family)
VSDQPSVIGLAYAGYVPHLLERYPGIVDYVEFPFELLSSNPSVRTLVERYPAILHCASLSMAGFVPAQEATWQAVAECSRVLKTPWVGEHLAFILGEDHLSVGYTVAPALNKATLQRVLSNVRRAEEMLPVPLLLENPPIYFVARTSEWTVNEFFNELTSENVAGLLLDLSHHEITCRNLGLDAEQTLDQFPLERVVELHLSGTTEQIGVMWDHHASRCPESVWRLLDQTLERVRPKAITIEYNWSANFPEADVVADVKRLRAALR